MTLRTQRILYVVALVSAVVPLWAARHLPMVDLPQHLMLISALHRLHDPTTIYPQLFEIRPELTPYLGYYWLVSLLNWVFPLVIANKVFLSAYVIGMPLSMAFLLRSLERPSWPSLLAIPFAYGDSFAWGFVNYVAAIPLVFVCCGLFVRAIADAPGRKRWAGWHAAMLVAVLLFHVQAFAFLAVGLPWLLFTTRAPEDAPKLDLRARVAALLSVIPAVVLFLLWVVIRIGQPAEIEAGVPWKAWGPLLSPQNLSFKTFDQNLHDFLPLLANQLRDGSDRYALDAALVVAAVALIAALVQPGPAREGKVARWRLFGLGLLGVALYFALPFDIRGYMYYLNPRFAHLAMPLLLAAVPPLGARLRGWAVALGTAVALLVAVPLASGYRAFDREARALDALADHAKDRPLLMGLIFNTGSAAVTHPVFLHAAAVVARERGGATNFTFALTPHSPLRYRTTPPPTMASEWRPDTFNYEQMAGPYDGFVLRGPSPYQVFGARLDSQLTMVAREGDFWLVEKR